MRFADLTTEEVAGELETRPLFLPVGTFEQHGPHLPLSVDCDIPLALCDAVADKLDGIVGPLVPVGARSLPQSGGGLHGLPGTLFVRGEILTAYLHDLLLSLVRAGARRLVLVNGHYENEAFLFEALAQLQDSGRLAGVEAVALSWWSLLDAAEVESLAGQGFCGWHAEHASFVETSLMMHLAPDRVKPLRVDNPRPPDSGIMLVSETASVTSCRGVLNRTSEASADCGARLFSNLVLALAGRVQALAPDFMPLRVARC